MLFPAEGAPPELQAAVTASREDALEQIRRLLVWGIGAAGSGSKPPLDVELFARMLVGLVIGLGYYVTGEVLTNSGVVFDLDPRVVAWTPSALLLIVMIAGLKRVR